MHRSGRRLPTAHLCQRHNDARHSPAAAIQKRRLESRAQGQRLNRRHADRLKSAAQSPVGAIPCTRPPWVQSPVQSPAGTSSRSWVQSVTRGCNQSSASIDSTLRPDSNPLHSGRSSRPHKHKHRVRDAWRNHASCAPDSTRPLCSVIRPLCSVTTATAQWPCQVGRTKQRLPSRPLPAYS